MSGIGSDAGSTSPYIRSRGKGEKAVREAFPATTLIRPSVMFGKGDTFLIPIGRMLRRLPIFPLFGRGQTQLQPAYVEDVADAITRVMQNAQSPMCYELGGPRVYTYRSLLEVIARHLGKHRFWFRRRMASGMHSPPLRRCYPRRQSREIRSS